MSDRRLHIGSRAIIGGLDLRNRLAALPLFTAYAHPSGEVSRMQLEHYRKTAASGPGLVVVGNASVSFDGAVSAYNLRVDDDRFIPGLSGLAMAIKEQGAVACLQLNHAGRLAATQMPLTPHSGKNPASGFEMSALDAFLAEFPLERRLALAAKVMRRMTSAKLTQMDTHDISRVINDFGRAAARAARAGFDMVELHGASGYLISQYLSQFSNLRQDEYGGAFSGRAAFTLAVLRRVRRSLPKGFPVGFRLMLREWVPGGVDYREAAELASLLAENGAAYLSVCAATYHSRFLPGVKKAMARPGYLRAQCAALKADTHLPVIISGRILGADLANRILAAEEADIIGLARSLLADPQWVKKSLKGQKVRACLNCNHCFKSVAQDQPLVCRRWPELKRQRVQLEHSLLSRAFRGLLVAESKEELSRFRRVLPLLLPKRRKASPVLLLLESDEAPELEAAGGEFIDWLKKTTPPKASGPPYEPVMVSAPASQAERRVMERAVGENHGVILMAANPAQAWRRRLTYRFRGKVVGLIAGHEKPHRILAPVDLSASSLMMLKFLDMTAWGKPGVEIEFVHVREGSTQVMEKQWRRSLAILGWPDDTVLRFVNKNRDVAQDLTALVLKEDFGMVVMGKRGQARIKRWLLGSVSAGVLRGLTDQSLILID